MRIPPAAPLPGGVKVAWRPVKPFGVGASPTLAANSSAECRVTGEEGGDAGIPCHPSPSTRHPKGRQADISWLHLSRKQGPLTQRWARYPRLPPSFNQQLKEINMTIARYLPQRLRSRWQKPALQKLKSANKKDRQVLPTLPRPQPLPTRQVDQEEMAAQFRIYWRM